MKKRSEADVLGANTNETPLYVKVVKVYKIQ